RAAGTDRFDDKETVPIVVSMARLSSEAHEAANDRPGRFLGELGAAPWGRPRRRIEVNGLIEASLFSHPWRASGTGRVRSITWPVVRIDRPSARIWGVAGSSRGRDRPG